jgi:tetratricopeptide (TPR) repeat protein
VAWLVIPLLPALYTFVFRNGELVHDRYCYLPSIGASMFMALMIDRALAGLPDVFGQPSRVVGAALALAAVLGLCAVREASFWRDDYTMNSRGHEIAPLNAMAMSNLASQLVLRQEYESAEGLLETGYEKYPENERIIFNLGYLDYTKKQYSKSEEYARKAIQLYPGLPDSYVLLGRIKLRQDKSQEAIQAFRSAVELSPYNSDYHTTYGIALRMNGDCAGANSQFGQALALNQSNVIAHGQILACQASLAPKNSPSTNSSQP